MKLSTFFLFFLFFFLSKPSRSQWTNLNANLPGDLYCVEFINNTEGVVGGTAGIYHTGDGGISWQRVNPTGTPADTMIYHNTKFTAACYRGAFGWLVVGKDSVLNKAVIFRVDYSVTFCNSVYIGSVGSELNDIGNYNSYNIAVGKNGLAIHTSNGSTWSAVPNLSTTSNLYAVTYDNNGVLIVGQGVTYRNTNYPTNFWSGLGAAPKMKRIAWANSVIGVGDSLYNLIGNSWILNANHPNPMNARAISFRTSTDGSLATDHGIFLSTQNNTIWELQSSSYGYDLNDISFAAGYTGYAVGPNGTVLKTTNSGGPGSPYINFSCKTTGCVDSTFQFTNLSATPYTFKWKNNGVQFATSYHTSYTFNFPGNDTIKLIGNNGTSSDSVSKIITVVNYPDVNKTFTVSDSILCKMGQSTITIHNSDTDVIYKLIRISPYGIVDSAVGNNGNITLNTGIITDSTLYKIKAINVNADCGGYFPDTILIAVEHTKANFYCSQLNAEINEPLNFIEHCKDENTYAWNFGANASPSTSTLASPTFISYSDTGLTQVTLIATSVHGCKDTITKTAAYIFDNTDALLNTPCWAINIKGQLPWTGAMDRERTTDIEADNNGDLLVVGGYTKAKFPTRKGVEFTDTNSYGHYLVRYNSNGVLKWIIHSSEGINGGDPPVGRLNSVSTSVNKEITVAGFGKNVSVYTNSGDSVNVGSGDFIIRYDSLGKLLWFSRFDFGTGSPAYSSFNMETDSAGNVYLVGGNFPNSFYSSASGNQSIPSQSATFYIAKLDASGNLVWIVHGNGTSNQNYFFDLAIDPSGNIIVTGTYSTQMTFNSNSTGSLTTAPALGYSDIFVVKYNNSGNITWLREFRSGTTSTCQGITIDIDKNENIYVGGSSGVYYFSQEIEFPVPGGTTLISVGEILYCSLTPSGYLRWATGTKYANLGATTALAIGKNSKLLGSAVVGSTSFTTTNFASTDNTYMTMPIGGAFYLSAYDTLGVLDFVNTEDGLNAVPQASESSVTGIDDDLAGNIYVGGYLHLYNNSPPFVIADTQLVINDMDGFIAKFGNACIDSNVVTAASHIAIKPASEIKVFPNPSSDLVYVENISVSSTIKLYDISGRLVLTQNSYSDNSIIRTRNIDEGIFVLEVDDDGKKSFHRIVITR